MKKIIRDRCLFVVVAILAVIVGPAQDALAIGQAGRNLSAVAGPGADSATLLAPGSAQLINPEDLLAILQSPKSDKPLILNVGPHLIYMQAHIPGAEFIGPASDSQ